jgi:hypothetical protein
MVACDDTTKPRVAIANNAQSVTAVDSRESDASSSHLAEKPF